MSRVIETKLLNSAKGKKKKKKEREEKKPAMKQRKIKKAKIFCFNYQYFKMKLQTPKQQTMQRDVNSCKLAPSPKRQIEEQWICNTLCHYQRTRLALAYFLVLTKGGKDVARRVSYS